MDQNLQKLLDIEYQLRTVLQRLILVFKNTENVSLWNLKVNELFENMNEEVNSLNLKSYSNYKIKKWMNELESQFGTFSFIDCLFFEREDEELLVPEYRLYNHLKNESLRRTHFSEIKSTLKRIEYYSNVFEARLLKQFFDTCHKYPEYMDYTFVSIFYSIMYLIPGLEHPLLHDEFHLENWVSSIEEYQTVEKEFISEFLDQYFLAIQFSSSEALLSILSYADFKSCFQTLIDFTFNYFTKEEINDKINRIIPNECGKEFVENFLNSHKPYLRIVERKK